MNKIGIVTVLYNSENVLEDFFISIQKQKYANYILYIIDNSPSNKSEMLVKKYILQYCLSDKAVYLPSNGNIGVAAGNNVGIKAALRDHCDYILLSNNDIWIEDDALFGEMIAHMTTNNIRILVPKIYYYNTKEFWFIRGKFLKFRAKNIHQNQYEIDRGQFDATITCDYAPTCFMMLHKNVFEQVGLMDEKYFVYYDDTDFIWRCKMQNLKVHLYTESYIEHKEGKSTGGKISDFSFFYFTRNRFYFSSKINKNILLKWLSLSYIFSASLLRSIKYKKTRIYFSIIKEFWKGSE